MLRCCLFFILLSGSLARAEFYDSLWTCWSDPSQPDTARLKALHTYTREGYLFYLPDSARYFTELSYDFAKERNNKKFMGYALNTRGIAYLLMGELKQAISTFEECLQLKIELKDTRGIPDVLSNMGMCYRDLGEFSKALSYYEKAGALYTYHNNQSGLAGINGNIAIVYDDKGNAGQAIEYYTKAMSYYESSGDTFNLAIALNNIATLYSQIGEEEKAMAFLFRTIPLREKVNDQYGLSISYLNLAEQHVERDLDSALYYYNLGLAMRSAMNDSVGIAECYNGIGAIYTAQGNLGAGLGYHEKALKIFDFYEHQKQVAYTWGCLANIYQLRGELEKAQAYAEKSLVIAQQIEDAGELKNSYLTIYRVEKARENYPAALEHYENYIRMRDSLTSEENARGIINQEFKYEYDKKAIEDSLAFAKKQEIEALGNAAELQAEQERSYNLYGGVFLLIFFSGFIFHRFRLIRKQKGIIEKQKLEVDFQKNEVLEQKHIADEKNKEILDSITYAKRIQAAILPPQRMFSEHLPESFVLYKPKDIVAGDFYWMDFFEEAGSRKQEADSILHAASGILLAAADCTGHGVPGAMVSVVCNNGLNRAVREYGLTEPGKILDKTREIVISEFEKSEEEVKDGMDISLVALTMNTSENQRSATVQWAGANNPIWIIRSGTALIEEIKADKQPIGKFAYASPFTTHTLQLQQGDALYIFTDGYADQFGGDKGKKFKAQQLKDLLCAVALKPMNEQSTALNAAFENWKNQLEQVDDVCIIGVRI